MATIDQGAKLTFQNNFYKLAAETNSALAKSAACVYIPAMGKTHNMGRIGSTELVKVEGRNPLKQYADYFLDNRQFSRARFTRTFQVDYKDDINELIADPTSDLLARLNEAKDRTIERQIVSCASGSVLVGAPDETPTAVTAANDGVLTITATGGVDYSAIQQITQNFINNKLGLDQIRGTVFSITGQEHSDLMGISQFINNDFISSRPVDAGYQSNLGMYGVNVYAGSVLGGITVDNPILLEGAVNRTCVILAPKSIAISYDIGRLDVKQSDSKVNSYDITIDLIVGTMRIEGSRVQLMTTTI
jgi:hypothetical protein